MPAFDQIDSQITEALNGMPLAPLPPHIISNVMAQIQETTHIEPFKLRRSDFVIAGISALFAGILFTFWLNLPDIALDWSRFNVPIVRSTLFGLGLGLFELVIGAALYFGFYQNENEEFLRSPTLT